MIAAPAGLVHLSEASLSQTTWVAAHGQEEHHLYQWGLLEDPWQEHWPPVAPLCGAGAYLRGSHAMWHSDPDEDYFQAYTAKVCCHSCAVAALIHFPNLFTGVR